MGDDDSQSRPGDAAPTGVAESVASESENQATLGNALASSGRPMGAVGPVPLHLRALGGLRGLGHAFAALRYPNYRLVWSGAMVSNIGSWMQNIARDWLVYELSGRQTMWLGLNGFVEGVALVAALPAGGVLADRFDRRRLLIAANAAQALLAVGLMVLTLTGMIRPWHIVLMSGLYGVADSVRVPAQQSLMPSLVDRAHLTNAVALGSLQFNFSRVMGPMIGGWVLFYLGAAWSFGANALSFLAVIAALWFMRLPARVHDPRPRRSAVASFREAGRFVRSRRDILLMLVLVLLTSILAAPATKLLPALAHENLGGDARTFSHLLTWFGAGAMIAALGLAVRSRRGPRPWRALPILALIGLGEIAAGWVRHDLAAWALCVVMGMCFIGIMVRLNSAVLYASPDGVRGRVSSFHMLAFRGGMPLGALIASGLAQSLGGVRWAFWSFGVITLAVALMLTLVTRRLNIRYLGHQSDLRVSPGPSAAA